MITLIAGASRRDDEVRWLTVILFSEVSAGSFVAGEGALCVVFEGFLLAMVAGAGWGTDPLAIRVA